MDKAKSNYWLGWVLFLVGLGLAVSGFVRWLVLPSGRGGGRGYYDGGGLPVEQVFIFDRHTWGDIHEWLAVVFLILVLVHIALHWSWIVVMTKRLFENRT
jgi:uncharacterized membrane protein YhaH (DUF805 family)